MTAKPLRARVDLSAVSGFVDKMLSILPAIEGDQLLGRMLAAMPKATFPAGDLLRGYALDRAPALPGKNMSLVTA